MRILKSLGLALAIILTAIVIVPTMQETYAAHNGSWQFTVLEVGQPIFTVTMLVYAGIFAGLVSMNRTIVVHLNRLETFAVTWLAVAVATPCSDAMIRKLDVHDPDIYAGTSFLFMATYPTIVWAGVAAGFIIAVAAHMANRDVAPRRPLPRGPRTATSLARS